MALRDRAGAGWWRAAGVGAAMIMVGVTSGVGVPPAVASAPTGAPTVELGDNFFLPTKLTVTAGTQVAWTWTGSNTHNVTVVSGPEKFHSGDQRVGTYHHTMTKVGTYHVVDSLHRGVSMTLKVTKAAKAATGQVWRGTLKVTIAQAGCTYSGGGPLQLVVARNGTVTGSGTASTPSGGQRCPFGRSNQPFMLTGTREGNIFALTLNAVGSAPIDLQIHGNTAQGSHDFGGTYVITMNLTRKG